MDITRSRLSSSWKNRPGKYGVDTLRRSSSSNSRKANENRSDCETVKSRASKKRVENDPSVGSRSHPFITPNSNKNLASGVFHRSKSSLSHQTQQRTKNRLRKAESFPLVTISENAKNQVDADTEETERTEILGRERSDLSASLSPSRCGKDNSSEKPLRRTRSSPNWISGLEGQSLNSVQRSRSSPSRKLSDIMIVCDEIDEEREDCSDKRESCSISLLNGIRAQEQLTRDHMPPVDDFENDLTAASFESVDSEGDGREPPFPSVDLECDPASGSLETVLTQFGREDQDASESTAPTSEIYRETQLKSSVKDLHSSFHCFRDQLSEQQKIRNIVKTGEAVEYCDSNDESKNLSQRKQEYMKTMQAFQSSEGRYSPRTADVLFLIGRDVYEKQRDYVKALEVYQEAIAIYSIKLGDNDLRHTDETRVRIGQVLLLLGDVEGALEAFCCSLHTRLALMGVLNQSVAELFVYLSITHRMKGQSTRALGYANSALKMYSEIYGPTHPNALFITEELAEIYIGMGHHKKAALSLSKVIKYRKKVCGGSNDITLGRLLAKQAASLEMIGNYAKAMKILRKARRIFVSCGEDSQAAAATLESMKRISCDQQRRQDAVKNLQILVNSAKEGLGENHPNLAKSYVALAIAYRETKQYGKGMGCLKAAMKIYAKLKDDGYHIKSMLNTLYEVAVMNQCIGDHGEALGAFHSFLSIRSRIFGESGSFRVSRVQRSIGLIYCEQGKYRDAVASFMESLDIMDYLGARSSPDFGETLFDAGIALEKIGSLQQARDAFGEALQIFSAAGLDDDHPLMSRALAKVVFMNDKSKEGSVRCTLLDKHPFEC